MQPSASDRTHMLLCVRRSLCANAAERSIGETVSHSQVALQKRRQAVFVLGMKDDNAPLYAQLGASSYQLLVYLEDRGGDRRGRLACLLAAPLELQHLCPEVEFLIDNRHPCVAVLHCAHDAPATLAAYQD